MRQIIGYSSNCLVCYVMIYFWNSFKCMVYINSCSFGWQNHKSATVIMTVSSCMCKQAYVQYKFYYLNVTEDIE